MRSRPRGRATPGRGVALAPGLWRARTARAAPCSNQAAMAEVPSVAPVVSVVRVLVVPEGCKSSG